MRMLNAVENILRSFYLLNSPIANRFNNTVSSFTAKGEQTNSIKLSSYRNKGFCLWLKLIMEANIWASYQEKLILLHVNNECADQPEHLHSLISPFVIHSLGCIIAKLAMRKISI